MNHNFSLWCLLSKNSSKNYWNTPSWWPDRPLLWGVLHLASRDNRYHNFRKMDMMLPFWCRQTPGNGTIRGQDCYHNKSCTSYTNSFGFCCWDSRSSDILTQKRRNNISHQKRFIWLYISSIAPCKGTQDSLGFWIPRREFRIPGTGFQSLSMELGFWI